MRYAFINTLFLLFIAIPTYGTYQTKPLESITLQLQWLDQFQSAGYHIAKAYGFYEEVGLDVKMIPFESNLSTVEEVVSGRAHYGIGRSSLLIDRIEGKPIVALAAIFQSSPLVLLSLKKDHILHPKDLEGKNIMLTNDMILSVSLKAMMSSQNVNLHNVNFQNHTFDLDDLITGRTDAMASYVSNEPFRLKERNIPYTILDPRKYGFDFYNDILFTTEQELEQHPKRVQAFYEASLRGWAYAFNHIEETAQFIYENHNPQNKSYESLIYEGKALKKLAYLHHKPLGKIEASKFERIGQSYNVMGLIPSSFNLEGFIYPQHTNKAIFRLKAHERKWLKEHNTIRIAIDPSWPPFEYVDDEGVYQGLAAEYLKRISERTGLRFEVDTDTTWQDSLDKVKEHKADLFACITQTPQRKRFAHFTRPYLSFPMVIVTQSEHPYVDHISSLKGKRIVVAKGYASHDLLSMYHPDLTIIPVKDIATALESVTYGKADVFIGNIASVSHVIKEQGFTNLKVSGETPYRFELSMAVRDDWPELVPMLERALESISPEERRSIYNQWIALHYEKEFDYSLLWKILSVIILLGLIILYWNYTLAEQIRRRKQAEKRLLVLNRDLEMTIESKIAELRQKDELLFKQTQRALLGELIGIIAHQLKQPLSSINIQAYNLYDLASHKISEEALYEEYRHIERSILFMGETIDNLTNFYSPNKKPACISIQRALKSTLEILNTTLKRASITVHTQGDDIFTYGIETELQQVFLNLITNAHDALIEREIKTPEIFITFRAEVHHVYVSVEDNGGGIPTEVFETLFDPYITTKGDQGTGIGLYMARMIISQCFSGEITVSNSEKGAYFTLRFPRYSEKMQGKAECLT